MTTMRTGRKAVSKRVSNRKVLFQRIFETNRRLYAKQNRNNLLFKHLSGSLIFFVTSIKAIDNV